MFFVDLPISQGAIILSAVFINLRQCANGRPGIAVVLAIHYFFKAANIVELIGNLKQNARAITGNIIRTGCAAMIKIQQDLLSQLNYVMLLFAGNIRYSANTTGIVLSSGLV